MTSTATIEEPLRTRLVRVADGVEVRRGLGALRERLDPPRPQCEAELHTPMRSARPAHVIVPLPLGAATDPAALQKALRTLKKRLENAGLIRLVMRRESRLYTATTRSQERRRRQHHARRKAAKNARQAARREWRDELRGL